MRSDETWSYCSSLKLFYIYMSGVTPGFENTEKCQSGTTKRTFYCRDERLKLTNARAGGENWGSFPIANGCADVYSTSKCHFYVQRGCLRRYVDAFVGVLYTHITQKKIKEKHRQKRWLHSERGWNHFTFGPNKREAWGTPRFSSSAVREEFKPKVKPPQPAVRCYHWHSLSLGR